MTGSDANGLLVLTTICVGMIVLQLDGIAARLDVLIKLARWSGRSQRLLLDDRIPSKDNIEPPLSRFEQ